MYVRNGQIYLSKRESKNVLTYDNLDFLIKPITDGYRKSKGGNSSVFKIIEPADEQEFVLKISRYPLNKIKRRNNFDFKNIARFNREIEALQNCNEKKFINVIRYYFDGEIKIGNSNFRYYVMEKADFDLTTFISNNELSIQQRFLLCFLILKGIKELHSLDIYHRDIKPDNILYANGEWKISDLGLIEFRNSDFIINEFGEKIGPFGWLSPEAMNKFLTEKSKFYEFDCQLDSKSDIFQLGKLFWYIFQGNVPIGQINKSDFKVDDQTLFDVIIKMLNHAKVNRCSLEEIEVEFKKLTRTYMV